MSTTFKRILFLSFFLLLLPSGFAVNSKNKPFVLVIDPGHGGRDTGAPGSVSKEKNINLAVAMLVGESISQKHPDVEVVYTRKNDVFLDLNKRSELANKVKANLFISIHTNANKSKSPYGAETYVLGVARSEENLEVARRENSVIMLEENYEEKYQGFDPNSPESSIIFEFMQNKYLEQSISLASRIQSELVRNCKRSDRGVRQAGFWVLRETGMPSVLVELGFISNREEEKYLNSKSGQLQLASSIVNAFTLYKKEYDQRMGNTTPIRPVTNEIPVEELQTTTVEKEKAETPQETAPEKSTATTTGTVYKVQILAADRKLSTKSSLLKGYKADYYVEKGFYKYTYGETSDWQEISRIRRSLLKDFKDAFIITFKDGKKVPNK